MRKIKRRIRYLLAQFVVYFVLSFVLSRSGLTGLSWQFWVVLLLSLASGLLNYGQGLRDGWTSAQVEKELLWPKKELQ